MQRFLTLLCLASLLLFTACKRDQYRCFFLLDAQDYTASGKTSVNGTSDLWDDGDIIYINGTDDAHRAAVVNDNNQWKAALANDVEPAASGLFYACFPGNGSGTDNAASFSGSSFAVAFPSSITITSSTAVNCPMVGIAEESHVIHFTNVCALLQLSYTGAGADNLVITELDTTRLAGTIVYTHDGSQWTAAPSGAAVRTLNVSNPGKYSTFYVPIPADTHCLVIGTRKMTAKHYFAPGHIYTVSMGVDGVLNGLFSVSASDTVQFSRGNLQYQASSGTWRFATNQYDTLGTLNRNISSSYTGWIDLFGWGTSGWNSGATCYQPYATTTAPQSYNPGGSLSIDLTGPYAQADWGVYNPIYNGGNTSGMWRTLTKDEWVYLLNTRTASTVNGTSNGRYAKARINGIDGMIIFPDTYSHPYNITQPININAAGTGYASNTYSASDWSAMEQCGAVFLPMTRQRTNAKVSGESSNSNGCYWSSTHMESNDGQAYSLTFSITRVDIAATPQRHFGRAVRLVRDSHR
ncbi:MAG: hypothetical protein J6X62_07010 [Bacteroidales bacterium]|nr:hypothetical protein [Bacteroidales bacterium]